MLSRTTRSEKTGDPIDLGHFSAYYASLISGVVAYGLTHVAHAHTTIVLATTIVASVFLMMKSTQLGLSAPHVILWRGSAMFQLMWGVSLVWGTLFREHERFSYKKSEFVVCVHAGFGILSLFGSPMRNSYVVGRESDLSLANLWVVLSFVLFLLPANTTPTLDSHTLVARFVLFSAAFFLELYGCIMWRRPFIWQYQWATTAWILCTHHFTMLLCLLPIGHHLFMMHRYRSERRDENKRWDPLPSLSMPIPSSPMTVPAAVQTPRPRQSVTRFDAETAQIVQAVVAKQMAPPPPPPVLSDTDKLRAALTTIPLEATIFLPQGVYDVKTHVTNQTAARIAAIPAPKPKPPVVTPQPAVVVVPPPPAPMAPVKRRLAIELTDDD